MCEHALIMFIDTCTLYSHSADLTICWVSDLMKRPASHCVIHCSSFILRSRVSIIQGLTFVWICFTKRSASAGAVIHGFFSRWFDFMQPSIALTPHKILQTFVRMFYEERLMWFQDYCEMKWVFFMCTGASHCRRTCANKGHCKLTASFCSEAKPRRNEGLHREKSNHAN